MSELSRRQLIVGAVASVPALWLPRRARAEPADTVFAHGVASGDPLPDRVLLWTRVSTADGGPVNVRWKVGVDRALHRVIRQGVVRTDRSFDHTVKVDAAGLEPGRTYYYAFEALGRVSPVGRTRTAPVGAVDHLRFAFASCSDYEFGYFAAYDRIADRDDLAFVVHLGDYIYEHGPRIPGDPMGRRPEPAHETVTLADYRARYAQHRRDPSLQRAHATHPWIAVWDDHELANNAWRGGAEGHDDATDGPWSARLGAATRAWWEWMPVRRPDRRDPNRIWRGFRFGDLVDLTMLDTRLYGRSAPETDTGPLGRDSWDPDRTLLGAQQLDWLVDRLTSAPTTWRVVGNQVMLAPHTFAGALPPLPPAVTDALGLRDGGSAEGSDNWNAYAAERARLVERLRERAVGNVLVISGDIHSSWAADVVVNPYDDQEYDPATGDGSVAAELVTTSVTAVNVGDAVPPPGLLPVNAAIAAQNPNVHHVDLGGHGYVVVDVDRARARGEWWYVESIRRADARCEWLAAAAEVLSGTNHVQAQTVAPIPCPAPREWDANG